MGELSENVKEVMPAVVPRLSSARSWITQFSMKYPTNSQSTMGSRPSTTALRRSGGISNLHTEGCSQWVHGRTVPPKPILEASTVP